MEVCNMELIIKLNINVIKIVLKYLKKNESKLQ